MPCLGAEDNVVSLFYRIRKKNEEAKQKRQKQEDWLKKQEGQLLGAHWTL